jgi:hypothetical protein
MEDPNYSFEAFLQAPRADRLIRIHLSRNAILALVFSLLIHALILLLIVPKIELNQASAPLPRTLEVSLAPPIPAPIIQQSPPETPIAEPLPEPMKQAAKKPPKNTEKKPKIIAAQPKLEAIPPEFSVPKEIVATKPAPEVVPPKEAENKEMPAKEIPTKEIPTKAQPSANEAPVDMQAYVNQKRAAREASEADAVKQNAEALARENGPSEEEKRDAKIKHNFQNGTNGIFEITRLESRSASFAFRGWTGDFSNSRKEFFDVEAKTGQDVRLVMIKRMIRLIRQHYDGDFNWQSQRLGRTIVMSARVEDSAGLEEFLMIEFFGNNYNTAN